MNIKLLNQLIKQLDIDSRAAIELIACMAVFAKDRPDSFSSVYRTAKNSQKEALERFHDTLDTRKLSFVRPDDLQKVIYFVAELDDYAQFADQLVVLICSQFSRVAEIIVESEGLVKLCQALAGEVNNKKIYDGAAGLGILIGGFHGAHLELSEVNEALWKLGKKLLSLKGIPASYQLQNSLLNGLSVKADLAIMTPPFAVRYTTEQIKEIEQVGFTLLDNKIPQSASDALWIQHALFHTNDRGKAILITPTGWLFRGGYDAQLRNYLLDHDLIEAIIALPPGLLEGTSIPCVIVVLNKSKKRNDQGCITFIDATEMGKRIKRQAVLDDNDIEHIAALATKQRVDDEHAKNVILPEIYKADNNLNVAKYIKKESEVVLPNLEEEKRKLEQIQARFEAAQSKLMNLLH
jgi:type I restriction enzyme M protein